MIPAVIAQLGSNVNARWRQIWSNALLQVERQLGINLEAFVNGKDNCLFVGVEKDTLDNLHINGIDWYKDLREDVINVVVGIKNYWFNKDFLPKLHANGRYLDDVINHYSQCGFEFRFERCVRLNSKQQKLLFYPRVYPGTRQGLEDYLRDVTTSGIYCHNLTLDECRTKFQALGDRDATDKLRKRSGNTYNWPEYLKIATPPLNFRRILAQDPATIAEFEGQIEIHLTGMILIDKIYR